MNFHYSASDSAGRMQTGHIDAPSQALAREELRQRGLYVRSLEAGQRAAPKRSRKDGGKRDIRQLAAFTRQLYVLLRAGTPLIDALNALHRQTASESWRKIITHVHDRVEEGSSFADALDRYPVTFDSIYRSMVAAGEATGTLDEMLDRLARLTLEQGRIRRMVIGALLYPAILLSLGGIVLVLMVLFVMPRFAELFDSLDAPLPPTTEMMIGLSNLLRQWWWAAIIGAIGSVVGLRFYLKSPHGKRTLDSALVAAPGIGSIVRSVATARIVRLLGVLVESRLPLLEAIGLLKTSVGNVRYQELLATAEDAVSRGESVSSVFAASPLIAPTVAEAMRSGEDSGGLGSLLLSIADLTEEDNETSLRTLSTVIEPLILAILGVIIGALAISLFLPLFDVATAAGAH